MPPLPRLVPPSFPDVTDTKVESELQGVLFIPLTEGLRGCEEGNDKAVESIGVVLVHLDSRMLAFHQSDRTLR